MNSKQDSRLNWIPITASFLILIGYFLPWIDFNLFGMSGGYNGYLMPSIYKMGGEFNERRVGNWIYMIHLIPIFAIATGIGSLTKNNKVKIWSEILLIISFLIVLINMFKFDFELRGMGAGLIFTLVGSVVYLFDLFSSSNNIDKKTTEKIISFQGGVIDFILGLLFVFLIIMILLAGYMNFLH